MRSQRKDEHIALALRNHKAEDDFSQIRFFPANILDFDFAEIDMKSHYFDHDFKLPIYINAMTGGSKKSEAVNRKLALLAKTYDLAMALGSQHAALDDPDYEASYRVAREVNPDGFLLANISANASLKEALRAIDMIAANALQIHVNIAQEMMMAEGDRHFKAWLDHIAVIVKEVSVPVIVKEVGQGMSPKSIALLKSVGVKHVDVSGRGGTNFIWIESQRYDRAWQDLYDFGLSAPESLLYNRDCGIELLASGGVRTPYQAIKLLALGAKAVGISGLFLELSQSDEAVMLKEAGHFIEDMKRIMMMIGAKDITSLGCLPLILEGRLKEIDERETQ